MRSLALAPDDFQQRVRQAADQAGRPNDHVSRFYVVGSVSSGKSSLVERLRAFKTFEEWPEPPLELMFKDPKTLGNEEEKQVDGWVLRQLAKKNESMRSASYGIYIMDRAPLDLFAFSKQPSDNVKKARELKVLIKESGIESGQIIFLRADKETLFERQVRRGRGPEWLKAAAYNAEELQKQADKLHKIYNNEKVLDTTAETMEDVARAAAEIILFGEFEPSNLEARRASIETGEVIDA
ncbi:hypothetical protein [uncultured Enterovirga sp.]|uniref:hypothetical protein n=1 Tax=uncultured Enterovirga sp. TaxID=2026352 RepID=UPI0035CC1E46